MGTILFYSGELSLATYVGPFRGEGVERRRYQISGPGPDGLHAVVMDMTIEDLARLERVISKARMVAEQPDLVDVFGEPPWDSGGLPGDLYPD